MKTTAPEQIRIAVVDDHPLFRQGLVHTLKRGANFAVVGIGDTAEDAAHIVRNTRPDILLLDLSIPGGGVEAARQILKGRSATKVIILTASDDEEHATDALGAGVQGYILKGVSGQDLIRAVEIIHGGQPYITPEFASRLLTQIKGRQPPASRKAAAETAQLTLRERQILTHISEGLTNKEIAEALGLSVRTVKFYATNLFRKMRVRNRLEAIRAGQNLKAGEARPPKLLS